MSHDWLPATQRRSSAHQLPWTGPSSCGSISEQKAKKAGRMRSEARSLVKRAGTGVEGALEEIRDKFKSSFARGGVTALKRFPAREARTSPFPALIAPRLVEILKERGIENLYVHQARASELASEGKNVVVVTPTASGKTLCYNLPILNALVQDPEARALYLFPTKALAQDQLVELQPLDGGARGRGPHVHLRR